jgi:ABC-type uncharacterized transport system fused permease/ATPase subunit
VHCVRLRPDRLGGRLLDQSSTDRAEVPQQQTNAAFRYALVRLRESAEAVLLPSGTFSDDLLRDMLVRVSLPHLGEELDAERDWAKVLPPDEQQRVAFA